jgi:hypothetical protein
MTEQQTAINAYYRFLSGSVNSSKYCVLAICAMIGFTAPALAADPSFEQPGPVDAHRFLPQALLESRQHPVSPEAFNDGFVNTYSVGTSSRVIEVRGTTALLEKWQEMAALDQLRRITDTQAFKSAVKNSAKQTAAAARNLFGHPLSLRSVTHQKVLNVFLAGSEIRSERMREMRARMGNWPEQSASRTPNGSWRPSFTSTLTPATKPCNRNWTASHGHKH